MIETATTCSPGLQFLKTASESMPRGVGDRLYSGTMNDLMGVAIRCCMIFDKDDAEQLQKLLFRTSVGVFDPMSEHFYPGACIAGGTYPSVWERHHKVKPWKAARRLEDGKEGRIAPGIGLLICADDKEQGLARIGPDQVWWCTSITADRIILGRYRSKFVRCREGAPARRATFTRETWDLAQKAPA